MLATKNTTDYHNNMTNAAERSLETLDTATNRMVKLTPEQRLNAKTKFQDLILDVLARHLTHPKLATKWLDNSPPEAPGTAMTRMTGIKVRVDQPDGSYIEATMSIATSMDVSDGFFLSLRTTDPNSDTYCSVIYEMDEYLPPSLVDAEGLFRSFHYGDRDLDVASLRPPEALDDTPQDSEQPTDALNEYRMELAPVGEAEIELLDRLLEGAVPIDPPGHWLR